MKISIVVVPVCAQTQVKMVCFTDFVLHAIRVWLSYHQDFLIHLDKDPTSFNLVFEPYRFGLKNEFYWGHINTSYVQMTIHL